MEYSGKPNTLKVINNSVVRKMFLSGKPFTCAQVSTETEISITTVRALVNEMLATGELSSLGLAESSGGRKSEQFIINNNCRNGVAVCVTYDKIYASSVNIAAEITETRESGNKAGNTEDVIAELLEELTDDRTRAVGIGVPGIVSADGFIRKKSGELIETFNILPKLRKRISLPVKLENDLRACTLGFAKEIYYEPSVAFIYFDKESNEISAGFVEREDIIHGTGNFAGELGLMPYDGSRDFREALFGTEDEMERMEIVSKLVSWVCCVINPNHIMLCGTHNFSINKVFIMEFLSQRLPAKMLPRIFVSSSFIDYYIKGIAAVTSEAILQQL